MKNDKNILNILAISTSLLALMATSQASLAQDAKKDKPALEEIIVTATKREKSLQDVPIAVTAFSGAALEKSAIRDIRDLQALAPAMNVTQSAASYQTSLLIRGIGTSGFNPGLEPSVGVYVDGVYRSRTGSAIGDFLSLERAEVLRGPQSTLFGKNTSAGVLSLSTAKPEFEFGGKAAITYGNFNQQIFQGTVTGPLVADKLAVRLSGSSNDRDGFMTNLYDGSKINDRDRYAMRAQVLYTPTEEFSLRVIGDYSEIDEACCGAPYIVNGPTMGAIAALGGRVPLATDHKERVISFDGLMESTMKDQGVSAEMNYDFEGMTLTSISAYRDFESSMNIDADFTDKSIIKNNGEFTDLNFFSQEVRLTSTGDNKLDWLIGGFYSKQNLDATDKVKFGPDTRAYFDILSGTGDIIPGVPNVTGIELALGLPSGFFFPNDGGVVEERFITKSKSVAVFGQFDFHLSDKLTVSAGLRYTKEDKDAIGEFDINDPFAALNFRTLENLFITPAINAGLAGFPQAFIDDCVVNGCTLPPAFGSAVIDPALGGFAAFEALQFFRPRLGFDRSRTEDKVTGNITISYDVNDDVNTYASVSRGYKAGGFDTSRAASTQIFDPSAKVEDYDTASFLALGPADLFLTPAVDATGEQYEFFPEVVTAYEVGAKMIVWDGRGRINIAAYYQKVEDFQSNLFTGLGFELRNAGDITIKGIEFDSEWAVTDNLNIVLNGAYSDAKYGSFIGAPCVIEDPAPSCDLSGEPLVDAPKLTLTSLVNYSQPISDTLSAFFQGEVYHRSSRFVAGDNDPNSLQKATTMLGASVGFIAGENEQWRVTFWGKNLTDVEYMPIMFDSVAQSGSRNAYIGDPRTYGLTIGLTF